MLTIPRLTRIRSVSSLTSPSTPLLALWCMLLFLPGITTGTLWRTEGLRALVAAECLYSGDWLVPRLYGEPFLTKPPGHYAAIALCSWPAGAVTEFTARLPSVLAATATVFLWAGFVRRRLGESAGFTAGLLLPVSFLWLDKVPSAEIDATQVFWVTTAIVAGVERWWLLAGLALAGGLLTKWTAPAFFYGTLVPYLCWRGEFRQLVGRGHLLAVAVAALICAGWLAIVVDRVGWDVLRDTVAREAAQRLDPHHGGRAYPWGKVIGHPFGVWAAHLPWSLFALLALRPSFVRRLDSCEHDFWVLCLAWLVPNALFWCVLPQHAARYTFPLAPAFAGLAVLWYVKRATECVSASDQGLRCASPLAIVCRPVGANAKTLRCISPNGAAYNSQGWSSYGTPGFQVWIAPRALCLAWLFAKLAFVLFVLPPRTSDADTRTTAAAIAEQVPPGEILSLSLLKDDGMMFYYGRPVRKLAAPPSSTAYVLLNEQEWAKWRDDPHSALLAELRDQQGDPIFLIRYGGGDDP